MDPRRADSHDGGELWTELMVLMLGLEPGRAEALRLSLSATVVEHGLGDAHDAGLGGSWPR